VPVTGEEARGRPFEEREMKGVREGDGRRRAGQRQAGEQQLGRRRKTTPGGPSWAERLDNSGRQGKIPGKRKKINGPPRNFGPDCFWAALGKEKDFRILIQGIIFKFKF
jgi:hypothetical protein